MTDLLSALLFGSVQGMTEFLPVSSSGHLGLLDAVLPRDSTDVAFIGITHGATLLAICLLLRAEIIEALKSLATKQGVVWKLLVATIPVAVAGAFAAQIIDAALTHPALIGAGLIATGIVLWLSDRNTHTNTWNTISWRAALLIGIAQVFALLPGISRSGISMAAGRMAKLSRKDAATFSFLLGIPTIAAATTFALAALQSESLTSHYATGALLIGGISAFGFCLLATPLFRRYIQKTSYTPYSIYTIALGVLTIILSISGIV